MSTLPNNTNCPLQFMDLCETNEYFYISATEINGLFQVNKHSGLSKFLGHFPYEERFAKNLHRHIWEYDKKLYFIPYFSHFIHVYDIENNTFNVYSVAKDDYDTMVFSTSFIIDNEIWMFPFNPSINLTKFSFKKNELLIDYNFWKNVEAITGYSNFQIRAFGVTYKDYNFWIALHGTNIVIQWNIKTNQWHCHKLDLKSSLNSIFLHDDDIWLSEINTSTIICWNLKSHNLVRYNVDSSISHSETFTSILKVNDSILAISSHDLGILEIDKQYKCIKKWDHIIDFKIDRLISGYGLFAGYHNNSEHIYFCPRASNKIIVFNKKENKTTLQSFICETSFEPIYKQIILEGQCDLILNKRKLLEMQNNIDLSTFINSIYTQHHIASNKTNMLQGTNIWNSIS